jgi:hypothetical protein
MKSRPLHVGDDKHGQPHFLSPKERTMGLQIFGAPGSGKSQGANHMLDQDERSLPGGGLVLDPHGNDPDSLYVQAAARSIRYRLRRPTYFVNLSVPRFVYGFNIFARREGGDVSTRVQRCVRALFTAWGEPDPYERPRLLFWSTALFAVGMHHGNVGLTEMRLLLNHEQAALRAHLTASTPVAAQWRALNQKRHEQFDEQVEAPRNRIDALVSAAATRRFLSLIHPPAMLDFRDLIQRRAWVFVNLQPSPHLDREHARVIGTLLAADFIDQACQRPNPERAPVALYLDEAHQFVSRDLATAFEEGRKFHIYTTLLHQHLAQLREEQDDRVLNAILSCARTKMVFAVGSDRDAKELVHEVFVGPSGINYTEPKHVQPQTKFRPIASREQSITRSRGLGTAQTHGKSRGTTTSGSITAGRSHTHTEGFDAGETVAEGESEGTSLSTGATRGVGATRTRGRNTTRSVADGVAISDTTNRSRTTGYGETEVHTQSRGSTSGTSTTASHAVTTQQDLNGVVTHTETSSTTNTVTANDLEGHSTAKTVSEATAEGESKSVGRSRVETRADAETESDAETWSEARNETASTSSTRTRTRTTSNSQSQSDAETKSTSTTKGQSRSESLDESESWTENSGEAITDAPGIRHEEFREDAPQFYSLEEQRQRKADQLRQLPQRSFFLRRPDCTSVPLAVPVRKSLRFSDRLMAAHEARAATRTGAVAPEEADTIIAERQRQLQAQAANFDQSENSDVHSLDADLPSALPHYDAINLTPRRTRSSFSKPGRKPRQKPPLPGDKT